MTATVGIGQAAFERYWAAVEDGDTAAAVAVATEQVAAGVSTAQVLAGLVAAAQQQVGQLWLSASWNVAREHRATAIGEAVLAALDAALPPAGDDARRALVLCADGEWHSLPSRIVTTSLRAAGWWVDHLGASVPVQQLAQLLQDVGPDLVAVSCSLPLRLFRSRQLIEIARAAGVPVVVGGRGFGPDGRWATAIGATAWAPNPETALAIVQAAEFPRFVGPAEPMPAPDAGAHDLQAVRAQVVQDGMTQLRAAAPDVAAYDGRQIQRTREDLGYIVDFLAAALFVDDVELFVDFVRWLDELLVARGVPTETLLAGLRVLDGLLGQLPARVRLMLAAGIDAAAASGG